MNREALTKAVTEYYRQRGWDSATGHPTRETLEKLGLGWVAELLERNHNC